MLNCCTSPATMGSVLHRCSQKAAIALFVLFIARTCPVRAAHAHTSGRKSMSLLTASGIHGVVIPVPPAAWNSFPNAHSSAACDIVSVNGLGWLDGDYTLANAPRWSGQKPAWIRLRMEAPSPVALSWVASDDFWAIGFAGEHSHVLYGAFLPSNPDTSSSDMPPAFSSRWMTFNDSISRFEGIDHGASISCPGNVLRLIKLPSILYLGHACTCRADVCPALPTHTK